MTREEMIEMARETRKHVTNAPVSEELLAKYPAEIKQVLVPAGETEAVVYDTLTTAGQTSRTIVINFHGGGFIRERTPNDELFCRMLSTRTGCRVLDVDYRVAPDYPFPTALNEAEAVYLWAREHAEELGGTPEDIILAGHSAGGNLAIGVTIRQVRKGAPVAKCLVCDYPPLDLWTDPEDKPKMGKGIPAERARLYNLYYCEREEQRDPLVSPVYATKEDVTGFPPMLMITAGLDDLCTEAEEFALKVARAGGEVTLKRFQNSGHAFTMYRREEYNEAADLIVKYVKQNEIV